MYVGSPVASTMGLKSPRGTGSGSFSMSTSSECPISKIQIEIRIYLIKVHKKVTFVLIMFLGTNSYWI